MDHTSSSFLQRWTWRREALILWAFLRDDCGSTMIPPAAFMVAAILTWHVAPALWPGLVFRWATYFGCFTLCMTIANQLIGIEEDRHNKPDRPLPCGLVTSSGAWVRWIAVTGIFAGLGAWFGVLLPTILWILSVVLYNFGGWARVWWQKVLCMAFGVFAQLSAAWMLAGPATSLSTRWSLFLAVAIFFTVPLQDLRDQGGDRVAGRITLPLWLGDGWARSYLAVCFACLPVATYYWLFAPVVRGPAIMVMAGILALLSWWIAVRILTQRAARSDHVTYLLYTGWYSVTVASTALVAVLGSGHL